MDDGRKRELHDLNTRAWNGEEVFPLKSKKLDSSIKRNTGFIKKLKKGFVKGSEPSLLKDLSEASLEKYLSEIIVTVTECLLNVPNKNDDVIAAVEIISGLHQRFTGRFTGPLLGAFLQTFENPSVDIESERDELQRITRIKGNLRVFTELYLVGVFRTLDDIESKDVVPNFLQKKTGRKDPLLFSILREILNYKFKLGFTTTIATAFIKKFAPFFHDDDNSWDDLIFDSNLKSTLQSLFKIFIEATFSRAAELHKKVNRLQREHQKCQIRTGKLRDEYIEEYDKLLPIFIRFKNSAITLGEFFELEIPELEGASNDDLKETASPMITNQILPPNQRLWENEDTRKFYEILPDISKTVEESQSTKTEKDLNLNSKNINLFFTDLEMADSKDIIDQLSNRYWLSHLDNKATRNRILKFFMETQDWSKLSVYSRFIATNSKYMPEIVSEFINYLDNGFRNQLHSNKINVKNIIFFSEMIKFQLIPSFMIFHKIRTLIMNMQVPNNVEILTVLLEHSGKFLLNKPEYKELMEKMVQLIKDKKNDRQLNMNMKGALENIITLLYPPSVKSLNVSVKTITPEQQFYRILIRSELNNLDFKHVVKLIRKAHWGDLAIQKALFSLFSKPHKISYQNIPLLTKVLGGLYSYRRDFVIRCIDQVLENIERGLEINDYGQNMHRISNVRYLTEIFNYEMIKSDVLLDTIYHIVRFGHINNQPNPFYLNDSDPPDNYFRIQLVTTILLNIKRTPAAFTKKCKVLLRFFEYYTFIKEQPLPKETEFRVSSTFKKYESIFENAKFERSENLVESASRLESLLKSLNTTKSKDSEVKGLSSSIDNGKESAVSIEVIAEDDDDDDDENDDGVDLLGEDEDVETSVLVPESAPEKSRIKEDDSEDDDEDDDEDEDDDDEDDDEEEDDDDDDDDDDGEDSDSDLEYGGDLDADRDIEMKRMYEEYEKKLKDEEERKAEDELERQFQQMMQESIDARKSEKVVASKIPVISKPVSVQKPLVLKKSEEPSSNKESYEESSKPKKIAFTFLTKSGKKTQSRVLQLPTDVKFVSDVLEEEEKLKTERDKIKKIVLKRSFD
ncbi:Nmd2p [Saccharomyces paradoxus]|uniref:Nmd2p n=1 Tax=Saccharomyces paradoxus TaxID=27291 RepID=A0A8B8USK0_SACPA|nr:Nmd2 [Saccharomyces paradoxus]QHS73715.1 Nmd2 [Saccharomyces paradoxus]